MWFNLFFIVMVCLCLLLMVVKMPRGVKWLEVEKWCPRLMTVMYIILACLLFHGCASMKSALDICKADSICSAKMAHASVTAAQIVAQVPGADAPLPALVGALVSLLVGVAGGHTLAKKKAA